MPNQNYTPAAAIPASERAKPSQATQSGLTAAEIYDKPYSPGPQSGDLAKFTQSRPFHHCADCGWDLPMSSGTLCSRCELARDHSQSSKKPFTSDYDGDDSDSQYNI